MHVYVHTRVQSFYDFTKSIYVCIHHIRVLPLYHVDDTTSVYVHYYHTTYIIYAEFLLMEYLRLVYFRNQVHILFLFFFFLSQWHTDAIYAAFTTKKHATRLLLEPGAYPVIFVPIVWLPSNIPPTQFTRYFHRKTCVQFTLGTRCVSYHFLSQCLTPTQFTRHEKREVFKSISKIF